jgi:hypothetical protein
VNHFGATEAAHSPVIELRALSLLAETDQVRPVLTRTVKPAGDAMPLEKAYQQSVARPPACEIRPYML